jgi:predicted phosphoribosyltransferase
MLQTHQYHDRVEAGHVLARHLAHYASRVDTLVLALPRGGVPVAVEVAGYLNAPLDAFMVHKLALPECPDLPVGAITSDGVSVYDEDAIQQIGMTSQQVADITARGSEELERRQQVYRGRRRAPQITGRVIIIVDDGLATGLSMHAAVMALHRLQPAWLVVAVPVGSHAACDELAHEVHEVVCPTRPEPFQSVGCWYEEFASPTDDEVRLALGRGCGLARP